LRVARFDLLGRVDAKTVQGDGSVRMRARLTRAGVFPYHDVDGGLRWEAKLPEDVFAKTYLDSLRGVTVQIGHEATITPGNWRAYAVGHVADDVRRDGEFIAATLVIKDGKTLADIAAGALQEISLGSECELEMTAGVFNGERYDAVQKNLIANHCGLGPSNWARVPGSVIVDGGARMASTIEDAADRMARRHRDAWKVR
jgi:uncharacterized protein